MTEEQRAAAAERLAKARAKRTKENPPEYKSVHPSVLAVPEDKQLNVHNVKEWIKYWKEIRSKYAKDVKKKEKDALAKYHDSDNYIKNMETYLRTGEWLDSRFGRVRENNIQEVCMQLAYHHKGPYEGMVKRSVGVYYRDINKIWTQEMHDAYYSEE